MQGDTRSLYTRRPNESSSWLVDKWKERGLLSADVSTTPSELIESHHDSWSARRNRRAKHARLVPDEHLSWAVRRNRDLQRRPSLQLSERSEEASHRNSLPDSIPEQSPDREVPRGALREAFSSCAINGSEPGPTHSHDTATLPARAGAATSMGATAGVGVAAVEASATSPQRIVELKTTTLLPARAGAASSTGPTAGLGVAAAEASEISPQQIAELKKVSKAIKSRLREYEMAFKQQHGRLPQKQRDWTPVWEPFQKYQGLRYHIALAEKTQTD